MAEKINDSPKPPAGRYSKIMDPVFVCMCIAVALSIGSSVLLRVVSGGASAAHASESENHSEVIFPAGPKPPLTHPQTPPAPATNP